MPNGSLRVTGWACDPQSGAPIRQIILVDHGRTLPVAAFRTASPPVATNVKAPDAGWAAFVPVRFVGPGAGCPQAFAVLADGRLGLVSAVVDRPAESAPHVASSPAGKPSAR